MSNKITNDDSFQEFIGKYITLTQNGVRKKYYVSEINKASFLSNVSILQGTNNTDFSFTSAGTRQKCDACDFPCISSVPIIQLIFGGKGYYNQSYLLDKDYIDEVHIPVINNYNTCTIYTSVLSADFNMVWLIPSNDTSIVVNADDAYAEIKEQYPSLLTSYTTSFSAFFFNPAYYYDNGLNEFKINHVTANNPASPLISYSGYNSNWFWTSFYRNGVANATYYTSRIITKKKIFDQTGQKTLSCYPWFQYSLQPASWGDDSSESTSRGDYTVPFPPSYITPEVQQVTAVFLDLNPCSVPNIEFYSYVLSGYYTDFTNYQSYPDSYSYQFPLLKKFRVYDSCSELNPFYIYKGNDTVGRNGGLKDRTIYYSNSTGDVYNGVFSYSDGGLYYNYTVNNGIIIGDEPCF